MARQAHLGPRFGADLAVWIVTGRATEARRTADLMRVSNVFLLLHIGMAAVANVRRDGAEATRLGLELGNINGRLILDERNRLNSRWRAVLGKLRRRSSRRHVVVRRVAVGARYTAMSVRRCAPFAAWCAGILLMAAKAQLGSLGREQFLKAEYGFWLPAARDQVAAGWAVALLARLAAVHIVLKRIRIGFVAGSTNLIVVNELRVGYLRQFNMERRKLNRLEERLWLIGIRCLILFAAARSRVSAVAAGKHHRKHGHQRRSARDARS